MLSPASSRSLCPWGRLREDRAYLWGALAITVVLEALALGFGPFRDLLGLTVLPVAGWAIAVPLATVPVLASRAYASGETEDRCTELTRLT